MDDNNSIDNKYIDLCERLSEHKLPLWETLPDIELYMDQVVAVMEKYLQVYMDISSDDNRIITSSIINNYVKLKVIPAPNKKKYSKTHIAYLIIICILKQTLSIQSISKIIERQLNIRSIKELYEDFKRIYESVIPFINLNNFADDVESIDDNSIDTVDGFILKSAILSTTGKFICEGILTAVCEETDEGSLPEEENKKEKKVKEKKKAE